MLLYFQLAQNMSSVFELQSSAPTTPHKMEFHSKIVTQVVDLLLNEQKSKPPPAVVTE